MTRAGRFTGYAFMAAAALLAVATRRGAIETIGPFPAVAIVLFLAMVGIMLVLTDLMVRSLYAQIDAVKPREHGPDSPGEGRDG